MKILLTNDDGFDSDGLQRLFDVLSEQANCYVVAPDRGRSCCGHAVTTNDAIRIEKRHEHGWAVGGTPADAVRIALLWLGLKPDLVISGVNQGGNLGVDIAYSGTVAAAREARILGCPSIAISQYMRRDIEKDWYINALRAAHAIRQVLTLDARDDGFWNVNLPAIPPEIRTLDFPISQCQPERLALNVSYEHHSENQVTDAEHAVIYKSNYQTRPRADQSDVDLCFQGHATVSWLSCMPYCVH